MHSTDVSVLLYSSNKIVTFHLARFKNISKSASNKFSQQATPTTVTFLHMQSQ